MHYPGEPPINPNSEPIDHWAHLEGKSDSMADDLAHQVDPEDSTLSLAARLLALGVAIVIAFLLLLAAIFSIANLEKSPQEVTPSYHQRAYP
jgi:hypothetical protein